MYALLLSSALAQASGNYPAALQAEGGADCQPSCLICHTTATGGTGTATVPFALALKEEGLRGAGDTASLTAALDALEASAADSDGDGQPDLEALAAGIDPSTGEAFCGGGALPTPAYGCVQQAPVGGGLALTLSALLLGLARRRGR